MTPPRSDTRVTGDAEAHHSASSSDRDASNDGASPPPNPPESVPAPSSRGPDVFANTAIMESVVRFAAREGRMGDVYRICLVNRQGVSVANRILYSRIPGWVANEGRVPTECVRWVKWIDVRGKPTWIDPEWKPRPCTPKVIGRYRKTFRHLVNLHWSARDVDDGRFVSADVVFAPEGTGRKPVLTCRWRARFRTDATAEVINRALRLDNKMWAKFDTSVEILDLQIDHSVPISASFRAYFEHESPPAGASIGKMELVRLDVRPENHVSMVILAGLMAKYTGQNLDNLSVVTENVMSIHVAGSGFKDEIDAIVAYFPRVRTLHLHSATSKYGYHNLPTLINRLRTRTPLLENLRLSLHIGSHTIEDDPYMQAASWSHGTVKELTLDILSERDLMTNMHRGVYRIGRSIAGILHPTGAIKVYHGHETHAQGRFPATARLNYLFTACVLWMQSMSQLSPEQVLVVKALKRTDAPDLSLRADLERLVARHGGELTTRPSPSESGPLNAR